MDISAMALAGMHAAQTRMEPTATRIAHLLEPEDHIDLSTDFVVLMESRNNVAASAKVLKTADQMQQSVLDLLSDLRWG
jgi:flagellar hook-associated protein FlgK